KVRPEDRLGGLKYDFRPEDMQQFYHLKISEAARRLHCSPITLKRCCKRQEVKWP
ncbi:hypothetical protein PHYSODRAFT_415625, partial [Phytophthora sojae]